MFDPHPRKLLLDLSEVAEMLGMESRTFRRFLAETPAFPRPIAAGTVQAKGRGVPKGTVVGRLRWRKWEVVSWLVLQPPAADLGQIGTDQDGS